jgi:flagellar protein FliO/FliZ
MDELGNLATYVAVFIFVIALIGIAAWILKGMLGGSSSGGLLRRGDRRLGVVEAASLDGRRKLVLIRRDNTEHLIMTGGPVDVLIESGIQAPRQMDRTLDVGGRGDRHVTIARDERRPPDAGIIERE